MQIEQPFIPLNIALLTISDSKTETDDISGKTLLELVQKAGHHNYKKTLAPDDKYLIRAIVSRWIADTNINVIITTGGTGVTGRDGTPEAILPLLDKILDGFGEIFRALSYKTIKTSTLQSRAISGVANSTYIFCLPGSPGACKTGWDELIKAQLNSQTKPCNLVQLMPRLKEK